MTYDRPEFHKPPAAKCSPIYDTGHPMAQTEVRRTLGSAGFAYAAIASCSTPARAPHLRSRLRTAHPK